MDSERHDRITETFSKARALEPSERIAFLDEVCAGDAGLREEVESLLAFDDRSDELLSAPVMDHIRSLLDAASEEDNELPCPDFIGPYRILDLLGEGGQGIIYKVEQATPRRAVALKVLRAGSFATSDDLKRFRREIRALALLRHPAIATIHDGGRTEEGRHFFTMEYVEGVPITDYVRDRSLSLRERLELFCKVCDGIQYAHDKGVIHRDLKPTNLFVDVEGNPKILDFGLVRIADLTASTASTIGGTGSIVGSFAYMSPEQACGKGGEIREQTDVYSLGMILYEILTGRRAYDPGPSPHEAVLTICQFRSPPPSAVDRSLHGDLDTIVACALEKESSRRYGSVAQMAEDVRRYLRGEPISVKPPGMGRILAVRIRKHRTGIALLAAAVAFGAVWAGMSFRAGRKEAFHARELAVELQYVLERAPAERILGQTHSLFEDHPSLPETGLVAAQAQYRAGVEHGPVQYLRHGMENSRHAWAFRLLNAGIQQEANPELARRLREQALLEFPGTAEAWYLRSFTTFDLREAIRCAGEAVARDPRHLLALSRLAYLCERTSDYERGHETAGRLLQLGRGGRHQLLWARFQALMLMRQGKYGDAVERYDSVLEAEPDGAIGLVADRALARLCMKDYERSAADYTTVIESGDAPASWYRLWRATPLWILGRREEAIEDYEMFRGMEGVVSYTDARLYLLRSEHARQLEDRGLSAAAGALMEKASGELQTARRGVEDGTWLRKILDCLAGECAPEELIQAADRSDREQVCEAFYYAAEAYLLEGRAEDARTWFRHCVATGLPFDMNEFADPMSEYHLANWRTDLLGDGS